MKSLKYVISVMLAASILTACEVGDNIDPVKPFDPGPDVTAPNVTITSPPNGLEIKVKDDLATINIRGEIRDDIELESVSLVLNGVTLETFSSADFTDYRRFVLNYTYTQVTNGAHTLVVTARDKSGKTTSQTINFVKVEAYRPIYPGEIFYMPFESTYTDLVSEIDATVVGSPGFSVDGKIGRAYAGATDAHITFPASGLTNPAFSATFWYKFTSVAPANRAGILSITPAPTGSASSGSRNFGFRFIREGGATNQKFNLNVGTGTAESWADGGANATVDPTTLTDWIFLAITISQTELAVFINGQQVVRNSSFAGVNWTGCTTLSIMSGRPNFVEWSHFSSLSLMDELRIFNKALTQEEIQTIMNDNP